MAKGTPQQVAPEYDKTNVGRRFRVLRLVRKMTPTQWAEAIELNCTPQKICNYESGDDQVPLQYAARACVLTGASFDYIYRGIVEHLPRELLIEIIKVDSKPTPTTTRKRRPG